MARLDKDWQKGLVMQSRLETAAMMACPVVTFDNVPREALIEMINNQLDEARESLED